MIFFVVVLPTLVSEVLSVRVFHSLQAGHWPDHLVYSLPQDEQKKMTFDFTMVFYIFFKVYVKKLGQYDRV